MSTLRHADYPELLGCGCVCAEHMEPDYIGFRRREAAARSLAGRRNRRLARQRGGPTVSGTAYLATRIGPGTTSSSEVAHALFTTAIDTTQATLFSNLTLPSGTYFLILASPMQFAEGAWRDACGQDFTCSPVITTDNNMDLLGSSVAYPPASVFRTGEGIRGGDLLLQYTVTGRPVPEPGGLALSRREYCCYWRSISGGSARPLDLAPESTVLVLNCNITFMY
jgi:hypothetical protein